MSNKSKIVQKLEQAQQMRTKYKVQIDYLHAAITHGVTSDTNSENYKITLGAKYNSKRELPFQFYKPYSKLFNLNSTKYE
jgi:hypothetical protein